MNDNSILMCFGITGNIVGNLLIDDNHTPNQNGVNIDILMADLAQLIKELAIMTTTTIKYENSLF